MLRKTIEGAGSFRLDYPRLVAVVTCHARDMDNALTLAWHSPVSQRPPLIGIALSPKRLSHELIMEAGEFAINFLPIEKAELFAALGGSTGRQGNKFDRLHMARERGVKTSCPLLHEAYAAYECKVREHHTYGDHEWFVAEVVAAHFDQDVIGEDGTVDITKVRPALYLSGHRYATSEGTSVRYLPPGDTARRLMA
ncbi:MAG: flavin reductase family protein [Chloroflexi bacterium]|nr:flavin reductase family protein [Chloroflexota bacterium]